MVNAKGFRIGEVVHTAGIELAMGVDQFEVYSMGRPQAVARKVIEGCDDFTFAVYVDHPKLANAIE